jgi:hypothetical protein
VTPAERFADFAVGLGFEEIPADVADAAKLHLLDTFGCGLAAHRLGLATAGRELVREQGGEASDRFEHGILELEGAPDVREVFSILGSCPVTRACR